MYSLIKLNNSLVRKFFQALLIGSAIDTGKEDFLGFSIMNEEQERMIANELYWFSWWESASEEDCR